MDESTAPPEIEDDGTIFIFNEIRDMKLVQAIIDNNILEKLSTAKRAHITHWNRLVQELTSRYNWSYLTGKATQRRWNRLVKRYKKERQSERGRENWALYKLVESALSCRVQVVDPVQQGTSSRGTGVDKEEHSGASDDYKLLQPSPISLGGAKSANEIDKEDDSGIVNECNCKARQPSPTNFKRLTIPQSSISHPSTGTQTSPLPKSPVRELHSNGTTANSDISPEPKRRRLSGEVDNSLQKEIITYLAEGRVFRKSMLGTFSTIQEYYKMKMNLMKDGRLSAEQYAHQLQEQSEAPSEQKYQINESGLIGP